MPLRFYSWCSTRGAHGNLGLVPIFVSMKVLWIAVALMTLILVGVGITDVVTGRAAISKNLIIV